MGTSKDRKNDGGLPWYVGDPTPTAEVIEEIVYHFHTYAILGQGKLHSGNEEEKRIARTFLECEGFVRGYFKDKARQIDTKEARDKAHDVLQLVVEFYDWFHPGGQVTEQEMESYMTLLRRWERVVQRFNMCMPSGGQQREQVKLTDTEQNILEALSTETEKEVVQTPPAVNPIPLHEATSKACVGDKWFDVTPSQMKILQRLNEKPGVWVSGTNMKLDPFTGERPDKIIKELPSPIRNRIQSKRGTGYRLI